MKPFSYKLSERDVTNLESIKELLVKIALTHDELDKHLSDLQDANYIRSFSLQDHSEALFCAEYIVNLIVHSDGREVEPLVVDFFEIDCEGQLQLATHGPENQDLFERIYDSIIQLIVVDPEEEVSFFKMPLTRDISKVADTFEQKRELKSPYSGYPCSGGW